MFSGRLMSTSLQLTSGIHRRIIGNPVMRNAMREPLGGTKFRSLAVADCIVDRLLPYRTQYCGVTDTIQCACTRFQRGWCML